MKYFFILSIAFYLSCPPLSSAQLSKIHEDRNAQIIDMREEKKTSPSSPSPKELEMNEEEVEKNTQEILDKIPKKDIKGERDKKTVP